MNPLSRQRAISSTKSMVDLGLEHGLSLEQCLANSGIAPHDLNVAEAMVSAGQELQVIDNLVTLLPQVKGLGLLAGQRYQITTLGIWAFAIISSPTIRSAIEVGLRYVDLSHALAQYRFVETADRAEVQIDVSHIPLRLQAFVIERQLLTTLLLMREMMGEGTVRIRALYLSIDELPWADLPPLLSSRDVHLGAASNRLVLDNSNLDQSTPKANASTAAFCVQQCEQLLDKRKSESGFVGEVRNLLLRDIAALPSLQQTADHFHISPRTLRRRLDQQGSSFRALVDETRKGVAVELLRTARLSVESIAARLGYAETASFIHAFQRWTGTTPGKFRNSPQQ